MPATRHRRSVRRTPAASPELEPRFRDELLKVIYERDANCPRCKYSLNGMVGSRCPECGMVVEEFLRMVDTMPLRWGRVRRRAAERRLAVFFAAAIVLFIGASIAYAMYVA